MAVPDRFWGHLDDDEWELDVEGEETVEFHNPLSLQILFPGPLRLDTTRLTTMLRGFHPSLRRASIEIDPTLAANGTPMGTVRWGQHVVNLVGFNAPMPAHVVEMCIQPAHYPASLKEQARAHQSHVILSYGGEETSPLEQYVALAVLAAILGADGAVVVLNESGHTSLPANALATGLVAGDKLELLRSLPVPALYSGFVKMEAVGVPGVWMRTYGNHLLGVPDLATRITGHEQDNAVFEIFSNIIAYLLASGAVLSAGHTMQVGNQTYVRIRSPRADEHFLGSQGEILVTEMISESQINPGSARGSN